MAEIAVAVLEVHEVEAGALGQLGCGDEVGDEPLDLVVRHERVVVRHAEFPVEDRVPVEDDRLQRPGGRAAEAAGMRQLQADDERPGVAALGLQMRGDQRIAQSGDVAERVLLQAELARVGAAVGPHGDGLAAPDQLGAAAAEIGPAPGGVLGGAAIGGAVPAFHGQHAEAVGQGAAEHFFGPGQRCRRPGLDDGVARERQPGRARMGLESLDGAERCDLRVVTEFQRRILHGAWACRPAFSFGKPCAGPFAVVNKPG